MAGRLIRKTCGCGARMTEKNLWFEMLTKETVTSQTVLLCPVCGRRHELFQDQKKTDKKTQDNGLDDN